MGARRILKLTNQGQVEFYEDTANGTNKIALKAPTALSGDITWTLPNADASGFFKSDGAGGITIVAGSSSLDDAYNNGSTIAVDTGAITLTVSANIDGLQINKTATGTGSPISIDNEGTGVGLFINQDGANKALSIIQNGAATAVFVDRATGGEVAQFTGSSSGDVYITVKSSNGRELRLAALNVTNSTFIGAASNSPLTIRTNNTDRMSFAAAANEAAIGGAVESGFSLKLYGPALITNNNFLQGETAAAANRTLIGVNASDQIVIGDVNATTMLFNIATDDQFEMSNKTLAMIGEHGERTRVQWGFADVTTSSGATVDTTSFFPNPGTVVGMSFRILTNITGPTSISCGISTDATRYLSSVATLTAGTTYISHQDGSATTPMNHWSANTTMRLTANGGNFTGGSIRCVVAYISLVAPTS